MLMSLYPGNSTTSLPPFRKPRLSVAGYYSRSCALRFPRGPLRDKHALVTPDDKPAAMVVTPADVSFPTLQKFGMQAKLNDAGVLEGKAENTDRGDTELLFRAAFRAVPLPQWKELCSKSPTGSDLVGRSVM
jgi:hypothetical protein